MREEALRLLRAVRTLLAWVYGPLAVLVVVFHYPYDTDATVSAAAEAGTSASSFYESAYQPDKTVQRGVDYEQTAADAARRYDIEGNIRRFVRRYGLEQKRILEVGSGRGALQDVVLDYTGLDLSPTVAANYHKPFVEGSATDMPFPDSSFDAVWTVWVVEHIPTPQKALEEMRRVIKPGGVLHLAPAWNCPSWLADGFESRPYSDFNLAGKLVKASIPLRRTVVFNYTHLLPVRATRWVRYRQTKGDTPLRFRRLQPNYHTYWQADSDAAISLDAFEAMLWFQSRGDTCLNCDGTGAEIFDLGKALDIRINKS